MPYREYCSQPGCQETILNPAPTLGMWRCHLHPLVGNGSTVNGAAPLGLKHDTGKPRMELLDRYALEQTAEVLTFGAKKYAAHNWRGGIAYSRLTAAAMRHLLAFNDGEDTDPETGLPHIAHLMCCAMFILGLSKTGSDHDDRFKPSSKETTNG